MAEKIYSAIDANKLAAISPSVRTGNGVSETSSGSITKRRQHQQRGDGERCAARDACLRPATRRETVPDTVLFPQPCKDLTAIEAPADAPMVFIRTSVIEGKRTGENTW